MAGLGKPTEIGDIADSLMAKNSPLMRRARAQGLGYANSRGMLNSSMGAEAAQTAVLDKVVPMAQTEAGNRTQKTMQSRDLSFRGKQADLDRGQQLKMQKNQFGQERFMQDDDQEFRFGYLGKEQEFNAGQNELERRLTREQNELERQQQLELQGREQEFTGGQAGLERGERMTILEREQAFAREQNALERDFNLKLTDKEFTNTLSLEDKRLANDLVRSRQDFEQTKDLSEQEFEQQFGMSREEFRQQLEIQERDLRFRATESELERGFASTLSDQEYQQRLGISKVEYEQARNLSDQEFEQTLGLSREEFRNRLDILSKEQGFSAEQAGLERDQQEKLLGIENEFRSKLSDQEYEQALGMSKNDFQEAMSLNATEFQQAMGLSKTQFLQEMTRLGKEQGFASAEAAAEREFEDAQGDKAFNRQTYLEELRITSNEYLAGLDAETRTSLMEMENGMREKLAQMELDGDKVQQVGNMVTSLQGQYQDAFRSILSNPDLDADTRNQLMRSMGDLLDLQMGATEDLYNMDITWSSDFDPVEGDTPAETTDDTPDDTGSGLGPSTTERESPNR